MSGLLDLELDPLYACAVGSVLTETAESDEEDGLLEEQEVDEDEDEDDEDDEEEDDGEGEGELSSLRPMNSLNKCSFVRQFSFPAWDTQETAVGEFSPKSESNTSMIMFSPFVFFASWLAFVTTDDEQAF